MSISKNNLIARNNIMIDPDDSNIAIHTETGELLGAVRGLPNLPGRDYGVEPPTLAEIKRAPIIGYALVETLHTPDCNCEEL